MPTVQHILAIKGPHVHSVTPSTTVLEATRIMTTQKVGSVLVMDGDRLAGIFTERDVLRRIVAEEFSPATLPVSRVMSTDVLCCGKDTDLDEASRLMRDKRIRHLPVCDDCGKICGIISIGDLNAYHLSVREAQIDQLHNYVYGRA